MFRDRQVSLILGLLFPVCSGFSASAQVNVLTYHNDNFRTGLNPMETVLTPATVKTNTFGELFGYNVDGYVYAQPLYVSGLNIPDQGTYNVVFIATEHNSVYAFDADRNTGPSGGLLWQANLGTSAATPNNDFGLRYGGFRTIVPEVGITGTPVIDMASGTLYVDAFTHEGSSYYHRMHALSITNGSEQPFSPVLVAASVPGVGVGSTDGILSFDAKQQLQRGALTLAGGILYASYAAYDDSDPFHGWVIGFNASNLQLLTNYVFNTTPNATVFSYGTNAGEGGIWMAGCGLAVDANTNLFFGTGNGTFNALNDSGGTEFGDSFIRLSTSGGLAVADYFTPYNQQYLANNNLDVDSGGVLLLPDQPGPNPHLMAGGGKEGKLYLINRDQMTAGNNHYNEGGTTDAVLDTIPLGGAIFHTPAWFNGKIYTAANGDVLASFFVSNSLIRIDNYQAGTRHFPFPGATPSISANGTNNGIAWVIQKSSPAVLVAYDTRNLTNELYNSSQAGRRDQLTNGVNFAVPTVANGKVYVAGQYMLWVFSLLGGTSPYDLWRISHFGTNANNPAIAGDQADPDHDGRINILEYAFASDPNQPDTTEPITGAMLADQFQVQFKRNTSASDLTYSVQSANALTGPWSNVMTYTAASGWVIGSQGSTVSESAPSGAPPDQAVTVTISITASSQQSFFRVLVSTGA